MRNTQFPRILACISHQASTAALLLPILAAPVAAQAPEAELVAALRAEITALHSDYEARLSALEQRLVELETAREVAPAPAVEPAEDELGRLRAAAREAAAAAPPPTVAQPPPTPSEPVVGRERNLNRLNPEISFTGILLGTASDADTERFEVGEFELDLQAALDPFSRTRWTIAFEEEEVDIEEAYVVYSSLPGSLELTGGKFRQQFGPLNRQHLHALPQTEYPLVITTFFEEEGLTQTGLSLGWLVPKPWATANEVVLQLTDGENEAFGGEFFDDLALLGRLKNFWELGDATYFEWGLSGIVGETPGGGTSRVWGTDFSYHWQPPRLAKYREITWRSELLLSERDDPLGIRQRAWGGYTYAEGLVTRNLYLGTRLDRAEDPLDPSRLEWAVVPYVTWWQSEWVRLRGEYQFLKDDLTGESENRFTFQLTWAAGPHKHETY
jgi:hypothetical protein